MKPPDPRRTGVVNAPTAGGSPGGPPHSGGVDGELERGGAPPGAHPTGG